MCGYGTILLCPEDHRLGKDGQPELLTIERDEVMEKMDNRIFQTIIQCTLAMRNDALTKLKEIRDDQPWDRPGSEKFYVGLAACLRDTSYVLNTFLGINLAEDWEHDGETNLIVEGVSDES